MNKLYFAKLRPEAKLPSKRAEDAGYDIYTCFDEDSLELLPHETKLLPTGLVSAFSQDYVMILKERGSTGSQGLAQRAGVIDSGYRGEIMVPITNTGTKPLVITKHPEAFNTAEYVVYPYDKAIVQALMVELPKLEIQEVSVDEIKKISSERLTGNFGSSGK